MAANSARSQRKRLSSRDNWLLRLLEVQAVSDKALNRALKDAAASAERELLKLADEEGIGAGVRRTQMVMARRAMGRILNELFLEVRSVINRGQKDAIQAAIDAATNDEARILEILFPDPEDRESYLRSLQQTAERNIQAMVTRMTGSERPLSRRVYHTKQLADGTVSRTINAALARGASVAETAKAVRDLIRPDVPGGVSYRAKTLARTEINNAYHAQAKQQNVDKPWIPRVKWNLSKSHPKESGCLCEVYAKQGTFLPEEVPDKPHPNCFCYTTPEVVSIQEFEKNLLAGSYNGWLNQNIAA